MIKFSLHISRKREQLNINMEQKKLPKKEPLLLSQSPQALSQLLPLKQLLKLKPLQVLRSLPKLKLQLQQKPPQNPLPLLLKLPTQQRRLEQLLKLLAKQLHRRNESNLNDPNARATQSCLISSKLI